MLDVPAEMNEDAIDVAPVVASSNFIDDRLAEFHTFHLVHVSTLVEKKTSCKTIMKNVYLARLWQKRQILQESGTKVISCKNRSKISCKIYFTMQTKILQQIQKFLWP